MIFQTIEPQQPHFIKKITDHNGWIIPGTKMTNTSPFLLNVLSKKSNFLQILVTFLLKAVEASWCNFFLNWLVKLKCPHLLKPLGTIIQHFFDPSIPQFSFTHFTMRHPVVCICICISAFMFVTFGKIIVGIKYRMQSIYEISQYYMIFEPGLFMMKFLHCTLNCKAYIFVGKLENLCLKLWLLGT